MVLDDNQKIGVGLICLGLGFVCLGIVLFLDASLIAIGNTLFVTGLCFSVGWRRTVNLFLRRDRIRGTICFGLGLVLVLLRWGLVGILLEGFGFLQLFGNFLPTVLTVARQFPVLGNLLDLPIVRPTVDFLAGKLSQPKYSV